MNIRDNKIQGLQMPVCSQLWEGGSVLLAYDAGLTESRAGVGCIVDVLPIVSTLLIPYSYSPHFSLSFDP